MQSLDLNLASKPFRNNTLLWTGFGVAALLLVGFSFWNVTSYFDHDAKLVALDQTVEGLDTQLRLLEQRRLKAEKTRARDEYDLELLTLQAAKANDVIGWKAFSWTRLFNRLERAQPWNVYMASIRPIFLSERRSSDPEDAEEARRAIPIAVDGYAKDLPALLAFERALFEDPYFDNPEPDRHAPDDRGEILFTMRFTYYPQPVDPDADPDEADPPAEAAAETGPADQTVAAPQQQARAEKTEPAATNNARPAYTEPPAVTAQIAAEIATGAATPDDAGAAPVAGAQPTDAPGAAAVAPGAEAPPPGANSAAGPTAKTPDSKSPRRGRRKSKKRN